MRSPRRPVFAALLLPVFLSGCLFGGGGGSSERPRASQPIRPSASGPVTINRETPRKTKQCYADLSREQVRYSALPDRDFGGGCLVTDAVQLIDIGVPVTGLKSMRCELAETFTAWVRHGVMPAAREILGSEVVRVETFGTYACRGIVGQGASGSAKISQHGLANAVDVSGFVLADGRRITIEHDWKSGDPAERQFLQIVRSSACKRFRTVLSPDYNAAHYNHFHFDMGKGPFCS